MPMPAGQVGEARQNDRATAIDLDTLLRLVTGRFVGGDAAALLAPTLMKIMMQTITTLWLGRTIFTMTSL